MISLFNIPTYNIDTSKFSNLLHDDIVDKFTENFLDYVNMPYGCAINSATNAIFLLAYYRKFNFEIPTMLPLVVQNALTHAKARYKFKDDPYWIGNSYIMNSDDMQLIDSAQWVDRQPRLKNTTCIYSFYPTKPVGSCDGGMIASTDKNLIDFLKIIVYNGTTQKNNSWERERIIPGWKMYMNSIQAYIANENLKKLDEKYVKLSNVKLQYDVELSRFNFLSKHLYIILVYDNKKFVEYMSKNGIQCGIHYKCLHKDLSCPTWSNIYQSFPKSEYFENKVVSIPFHENLTERDIEVVIRWTKMSGMLIPSNDIKSF